ncbi:DUF4350 domain-containing protein [Limnovirga soli]|uniref:DUF4350 domain-containing protein n=1 Tax=Limnovirga soli TaxID=2656915 RepID=A0A8J8FBY9_9BACT|nr:DUF4350 domain-containing protein [Limnovirga soli]NNV55200.1 DUF4350 domain-containing protein [Limnovirga soli]
MKEKKGNKIFIILFAALLVLYMIAQANMPQKFDWSISLRNNDKNPFGAYITYTELNQLFPKAEITSQRIPAYNLLHDANKNNAAYILINPEFNPGKLDIEALLDFAAAGNTVFIAAIDIDKKLKDTLGISMNDGYEFAAKDSTSINLVNPALKSPANYTFLKQTIDGFFDTLKTPATTTILGVKQSNNPNFIRVKFGKGQILLHAAPVCFSNYFMLTDNNKAYTAKALSYIPSTVQEVIWDEYYKSGRLGSSSMVRFFLSDAFLSWAWYLTLAALVIYVLFEIKRRQRIIPVIEPLRNTTLDFVETVSSVYYSQHDNNSIARKKVQFWFDHIRRHYYLPTTHTDEVFVQQLHRKSGAPLPLIQSILELVKKVEMQPVVTDDVLLAISNKIDEFYTFS